MNLTGSYRALVNNAKAAMLAAIEIYNKPQIEYRDECFVILLVNAWELLLKSILSKNNVRIYYPKKRNEPYRTLTIQDSLNAAKAYFPVGVSYEPVSQNINMLVTYRNNAIHFYNQKGFSVIIFGLAQTSIINFRDIVLEIFNIDVSNEMTMSLLPLSFGSQPDPIEFLSNAESNRPKSKAVAQFLREIATATSELEKGRFDTSRFLTVFSISLQSIKKVASADITASIGGPDDSDTLIIEKRVDPNVSHPLRRKDILNSMPSMLGGIRFTSYTFEAIIWKLQIKEKAHLCWRADVGGMTRYSNEVPSLLQRVPQDVIGNALEEYRMHLSNLRRR